MKLTKIEIILLPNQESIVNLSISPSAGETSCVGTVNLNQQHIDNLKIIAENLKYQVDCAQRA